tara:strand:- start:134 stop:466 length:333 start_codon:yes stop_codon:yes gene_type:complete
VTQFKLTETIIIKQNHLLNGNGAARLRRGGKDIAVPKYTVKPLEEGDEYDIECSADELQDYLKKHNCIKVLKFPGVIAHHGSLLSKTDQGWKDNLKRIKQNSGRGNTIKI